MGFWLSYPEPKARRPQLASGLHNLAILSGDDVGKALGSIEDQ